MRTADRIVIHASLDRVFAAARDVERWPEILPHYRWVRFLERGPDKGGIVEMAAWRPFGPLGYPAWWVSEMRVDASAREIRYRHVRGITRGMDVVWRLRPDGAGAVHVEIVHEWDGPPWPLVGRAAARVVIGPVFVHGIASRTLAGIKRHAERTG
ncbi:MAG: SRPBCC family protein [Gemmatimonadetes bacterium]|nr:SRPBCC family protein [Gemmatimonadota bacterium]